MVTPSSEGGEADPGHKPDIDLEPERIDLTREIGRFGISLLGLVRRLKITQLTVGGNNPALAGEVYSSYEEGDYLTFTDNGNGEKGRLFGRLKVWQGGQLIEAPPGTQVLVEIDASSRIRQKQELENPDRTILHVKVGSYGHDDVFRARHFAVETDDTIRVQNRESQGFPFSPHEDSQWSVGRVEAEGVALRSYLENLQSRIANLGP